MLAVRDTTVFCLTWTFRFLGPPNILKRFGNFEVSEISGTVGVGGHAELPDRNTFKKMKYLGFALMEVPRLYPSVPINARIALKTTILPTGGGPYGTQPVMIRKGEGVG